MKEQLKRDFGDSMLTGNDDDLERFYLLLEQKDYGSLALDLGKSEACPVAKKIIDQKGAKAAAEGYSELQFIRGTTLEIIRPINPIYYQSLTETKPRVKGELPNEYDLSLVPPDHLENVRGNATMVGFGLPRLIRAFIGSREKRTTERITKAFDVFEEILLESTEKQRTPIQFVVSLAEKYATLDHDPIKYLQTLLGAGKLQQDNLEAEATLILANMHTKRTSLWEAYQNSSLDETKKIAMFGHQGSHF